MQKNLDILVLGKTFIIFLKYQKLPAWKKAVLEKNRIGIDFYLRTGLFALGMCFCSPGTASGGSIARDGPNMFVT